MQHQRGQQKWWVHNWSIARMKSDTEVARELKCLWTSGNMHEYLGNVSQITSSVQAGWVAGQFKKPQCSESENCLF